VLSRAVPSLSADPRPSSAQLLWITDISGFLLAGSLITIGPWATASDEDGGWPER
jgi:DHA2 family multidrug resistance protein-like MFS transporter